MERRRFGPDYITNDKLEKPESLPENLPEQFRHYYAELTNEQKAWNAQWYAEDHNDARREQRQFLLMFIGHMRPAVVQTLYQLLPPFKQIFSDQSDPIHSRFHFIHLAIVSFSEQYLKVSQARREELDQIIDAKLKARAQKPHASRQPSAPVAEADPKWQFMILQQIEFGALKRLVPKGMDDEREQLDERFIVIYRPLYQWLARWNLLAPWVADVALSTLLDWDWHGVTQEAAHEFTLIPRPKRTVHNMMTRRLPKLAAAELHFEFEYQADWNPERERFHDFEKRYLKAVRDKLDAFKTNIDEKMLEAGYEQVKGRTNIFDLEPFRWLTRYQIDGFTFEQIAEEEFARREREQGRDDECSDLTPEDLEKFVNLKGAIKQAVERLAERISLTLRETNRL